MTGSSRGLGRTLALGLAEAGARVTLHGRDPDALATAADEIAEVAGELPATVRFDVTDARDVQEQVEQLVAEQGVPDILVNNAGLQRRAPIGEFAVDDWDAVIASNLSSMFYVSRFVVPGMTERGSGKIINIASVQSKLARQTIAPYSASKGGVALLTQGMAADLARHGVHGERTVARVLRHRHESRTRRGRGVQRLARESHASAPMGRCARAARCTAVPGI